jgi:hypothetical protein
VNSHGYVEAVHDSDGWLVEFALSTFLTFLGAGGFGMAGALVLDYFGVLGGVAPV